MTRFCKENNAQNADLVWAGCKKCRLECHLWWILRTSMQTK